MNKANTDTAADNLARNIRQLREGRNLSQQKLAQLSGLPRPTWANLESGSANPTLSVLLKVSTALQVSLEELVGPPKSAAKLYGRADLRSRKRGRVIVSDLLPDRVTGLQLERFQIPAKSGMTGIPHTAGTREYLCCEQGQIQVTAGGEQWTVAAGEVLVFRGDQKHAYRNTDETMAIAYSVVALAPAS